MPQWDVIRHAVWLFRGPQWNFVQVAHSRTRPLVGLSLFSSLSPMGTLYSGNSLQNKLVISKALSPGLISKELS